MELYNTARSISNTLDQLQPPPQTWTLARRLSRLRNPRQGYTTGAYARRRSRAEHQLQAWLRQLPRIIGQLRAVSENRDDGAELRELADALEALTPARLGAIEDRRERKGRVEYRTRWYIPDAALDNCRVYIRAARWVGRFVALCLGSIGRALRALFDRVSGAQPRRFSMPTPLPLPHPVVTTEGTTEVERGTWEEVAARIARRIETDTGAAMPPTTT